MINRQKKREVLVAKYAVRRAALKAIARDKVGSFKERADMQTWLTEWINRYVLANPAFADDKANCIEAGMPSPLNACWPASRAPLV